MKVDVDSSNDVRPTPNLSNRVDFTNVGRIGAEDEAA